ncbi:MAG: thiamine diphosphokinase [Acholeplasmataceae bacterium]
MRAIVITYPTPNRIRDVVAIKADDFVIVVDQAFDYARKQQIPIDLVVGDFDSLADESVLAGYEVYRLPVEKDVTDTDFAVAHAYDQGYQKVLVVGGFGGKRSEHFLVHTMLFDRFPDLIMIDETSRMFMLESGRHPIEGDGFVSIFAYPKARIALKGFKFPLDDYDMELFDPLGISNEVSRSPATIEIRSGRVLVIRHIEKSGIKK